MGPETIASQFARKFRVAMAPGAKDTEYRDLHHFVLAQNNTKALDDCLDQYLSLYRNYPVSDPRSRQIFLILLEHRIDATPAGDPYLQDLGDRLRGGRQTPSPIYSRFQTLNKAEQDEINKHLNAARLAGTILDELRQAYLKAKGRNAKTLDELRNFDPAPDPALEKQFRAQVKTCDLAWSATNKFTVENWEAFTTAFANFGEFIKQNSGNTLTLCQLLKWSWDPFKTRIVGSQQHTTPAGHLDIEYYLRIAFAFYMRGVSRKTGNLQGLSREEHDFLFDPLKGYLYYEDYENRFSFGTKGHGNAPGFYNLSLLHLQMLRFAFSKNVSLAPAKVAGAILSLYESAGELASQTDPSAVTTRRSFHTVTQIEVAKQNFFIGDTMGVGSGELRILYFEGEETGKPTIYIEFLNLPSVVFTIDISNFTARVEALPRLLIWRDNKGLADLIETFMGVIMDFLVPEFGYVATFMERGIGGVLLQVAEQKAFDLALEAVNEAAAKMGPGLTLGVLGVVGALGKKGKLGRLSLIKQAAQKLERVLLPKAKREFLELAERRGGQLATRELGDLGLHPQVDDRSTVEKLMEQMAEKDRRALERQTEARMANRSAATVDTYVKEVQTVTREETKAIRELTAEANTMLRRDGRIPQEWTVEFPRTASTEAGIAQTRAVGQKGMGGLEDREILFKVDRKTAMRLGVKREVRFDGFKSFPSRKYMLLEHKEVMAVWQKSRFSKPQALDDLVNLITKHGEFLGELRAAAPNSWWVGVAYSGGGDKLLQDVIDKALIRARERLPKETGKLLFSAGE